MKNIKRQKNTLVKSSLFSIVIAVAIVVIGINLCILVGLVCVIASPRFEVFSTNTFIVMGITTFINFLVLILLLLLRRVYETLVNKKIVVPLREIERHIIRFAHDNYDEPVIHSEDDEIGDLFKAVERVRIQLIEYRDKENNAAELKKIYFSGLMHDIATPVTRINGCASMIADGMVTDEQSIKRFASTILRSTEDISIMLKSIAAIEKYNESGMNIDLQPIDIAQALEVFVSDLKTSINNDEVSVMFVNKCKLPAVSMIDLKSCKRAVANLINNSIKYKKTDCNCEITVSIEDNDDGKILFAVADNGVGVEPGAESKIFDIFYRGDAARRNTSEGSGLGLFIAKQILTLNNIDVWAENNGNGLTVFALLERSDKKPVNWFKLEK
ncbi:MAG: HAMP domain-containing histidine kinase [Clostridia bacterium]|nr:HAMP domain-containing histidine kinase [Clostridia bacterium]